MILWSQSKTQMDFCLSLYPAIENPKIFKVALSDSRNGRLKIPLKNIHPWLLTLPVQNHNILPMYQTKLAIISTMNFYLISYVLLYVGAWTPAPEYWMLDTKGHHQNRKPSIIFIIGCGAIHFLNKGSQYADPSFPASIGLDGSDYLNEVYASFPFNVKNGLMKLQKLG